MCDESHHLKSPEAAQTRAILPLLRKLGQPEKAREIHARLRPNMVTQYDQSGSIGRRYRRQDEIGTPFCVTIDHQTMEDGTVTLRDRDALTQDRVHEDELQGELMKRLFS